MRYGVILLLTVWCAVLVWIATNYAHQFPWAGGVAIAFIALTFVVIIVNALGTAP